MIQKKTAIHTAGKESLFLWPSYITTARTILTVIFGFVGVVTRDISWLGVGLLIYWTGDVLDGYIARKLDQETRLGAIFDIVSDRICVVILYIGFGLLHPELLGVIIAFIFCFVVIDGVLSLSFLLWGIMSPNYFYNVDEKLYKLNWSPVGKGVNSSVFVFVTLIFQNVWLSGIVVVLIYVVKLYSLYRLHDVVSEVPLAVPSVVQRPLSDRRR